MVRGPSESKCKPYRRHLFKPSAIEVDNITFLIIPLLDYNILLNTKLSNISASIPPSTLPPAMTGATNKTTQICVYIQLSEGKLPHDGKEGGRRRGYDCLERGS
jgi:hypothetical protein